MARLTLEDEPRPEQWFDDPAAGTGGLLRATAQRLRETGRDPGDFGWALNDVDPIASACCGERVPLAARPEGAGRVQRHP
ncbi:hypothetical protein SVIO_000100 [Streptomyces violaceusniger]|uniref:DNA methylase adenine-specific domain-containing protein n=2 Tax=Streptomyces violaceusniger TaxID=68280 RepID=A0A4D4KSE7_STRVO|nr:hypothetical protein SVIO_000100 [Streptomyces violaceusniger]